MRRLARTAHGRTSIQRHRCRAMRRPYRISRSNPEPTDRLFPAFRRNANGSGPPQLFSLHARPPGLEAAAPVSDDGRATRDGQTRPHTTQSGRLTWPSGRSGLVADDHPCAVDGGDGRRGSRGRNLAGIGSIAVTRARAAGTLSVRRYSKYSMRFVYTCPAVHAVKAKAVLVY